jgi:hypothetical protein
MNPFTLDDYAREVMHDRLVEADKARLIAQLPHTAPAVQMLGVAARSHVADGLRVLARRLDPTAVPAGRLHQPEGRLVIARSR